MRPHGPDRLCREHPSATDGVRSNCCNQGQGLHSTKKVNNEYCPGTWPMYCAFLPPAGRVPYLKSSVTCTSIIVSKGGPRKERGELGSTARFLTVGASQGCQISRQIPDFTPKNCNIILERDRNHIRSPGVSLPCTLHLFVSIDTSDLLGMERRESQEPAFGTTEQLVHDERLERLQKSEVSSAAKVGLMRCNYRVPP